MDGLLLFNPFCGNGLGELDMLDPAMSPVIDLTKIAIPIIPAEQLYGRLEKDVERISFRQIL
jgi:hypothetical protein